MTIGMNSKQLKPIEYLNNLKALSTNHGVGNKFLFRSDYELNNNLTQIAYGSFLPGESCELHSHLTMDEYFFIIRGVGEYLIGDEVLKLKEGTFIEILAGTPHMLSAFGSQKLEFVYWGVSVVNS
jgi:mannose-6-phosphate isomerase-like protein (cupin superfamily)